jgi:hypothetical protein
MAYILSVIIIKELFMRFPVSPPDLSQGKYDDCETHLSNVLGLKVMLVRGWERPEAYGFADMDRWGLYENSPELAAAQENFEKVEATTLASLRANIADRDSEVGHELTDNDLRSLLTVGHITKKEGNAGPEEAVLLFDPGEREWLDENQDPVLNSLLSTHFRNAWDFDMTGTPPSLKVKDVIENFDIAAEDLRHYKAVVGLRHALQHQDAYNLKDRAHWSQPFFYRFSGLASAGERPPGI